jgi:hypothetical protein
MRFWYIFEKYITGCWLVNVLKSLTNHESFEDDGGLVITCKIACFLLSKIYFNVVYLTKNRHPLQLEYNKQLNLLPSAPSPQLVGMPFTFIIPLQSHVIIQIIRVTTSQITRVCLACRVVFLYNVCTIFNICWVPVAQCSVV